MTEENPVGSQRRKPELQAVTEMLSACLDDIDAVTVALETRLARVMRSEPPQIALESEPGVSAPLAIELLDMKKRLWASWRKLNSILDRLEV